MEEDVPVTLKIRCGKFGGGKGAIWQEDKSATLACNNDQTLFVPEGCNWDGSQTAPTLTSHNAGGSQRMPDKQHFNCVLQPFGISSFESNAMKSNNPHSGIYEAETSRTLDCSGGNPANNQGGVCIVEKQPTYSIQGSMIGRDDKNGPQGSGVNKNVSFTLNTCDRHAICAEESTYAMTTGSYMEVVKEQAPTLMAREYKDPTTVAYGVGRDTFNQGCGCPADTFAAGRSTDRTGRRDPGAVAKPEPNYTVRRLTPTECARLQGFPDWWCDDLSTDNPTEEELAFWKDVFETHRRVVSPNTKPKPESQIRKWLKNPYSDSSEYKMWGNGLCINVAYFVLSGIAWVEGLNGPIQTKSDENIV